MEYTITMLTVVETPSYLKAAEALFSEAERENIVLTVATDPECGEVMQGNGGFRKVRVGRSGMGKSGGARAIYILRNEQFPLFLVAAYPKNHEEDLSMRERNELARRADEIFTKHKR